MRLFLLDNDDDFRREWVRLLRDCGHTVGQCAGPHKKTPDEVHGKRYDLALVDLRAEDDRRSTDKSGQLFAMALCSLGTPAVVVTAFPPSAKEMSSLVRGAAVTGFVRKSLSMWEITELIGQYGRCRRFPNGIAEFRRSDHEGDMGEYGLWQSVQAELASAVEWSPPSFQEFSVLFRSLISPCACSVSIRSARKGTGGASLVRAEISHGDAPVTEDLAIKFGKPSIILDEMMRYDRYVGPLPDGAATQLRYRSQTEHLAAIAYSWVGDSFEEGRPMGPSGAGEYNQVTWDCRRSAIRKLFSRYLNGWYKVYRDEDMSGREPLALVDYYLRPGGVWAGGLKSLYDLTLPLGRRIKKVDRGELDFGPDYGRLVDPRWWAHSGGGSELRFGRQCPSHGDLHVQNLYILPDGSPRLIDFGRTSVGHVFRDFAALEVSLRLTCVEKTMDGNKVNIGALALMEDIVSDAEIGSLADCLDFRRAHSNGHRRKIDDDVAEAIRTTMEIRRAALDAVGSLAEDRAFEQYLFAVVVHMLRYAAGKADEIQQTGLNKTRQKRRNKLRAWHATYGAARAATKAVNIA